MYNYKDGTDFYDDAVEFDFKKLFDRLLFGIERNIREVIFITLLVCELVVSCTALMYTPKYSAFVTYIINKTGDDSVDANVASALGISLWETYQSSGLEGMIRAEFKEEPKWLNVNQIVPSYDELTNILTLTVTTDNYYNTNDLFYVLRRVYPKYAGLVEGTVRLSILNEADANTMPDNSYNIIVMAIIGLVMGLLLSCVYVGIKSLMRVTICGKEDMERISNLDCIEEIPAQRKIRKQKGNADLSILDDSDSFFIQSMRTVAHRVGRSLKGNADKVLMVTSAVGGEGKSTVAANLAVAMAEHHNRVILVDADLRNPSIARVLNQDAHRAGLDEYLQGGVEIKDCIMKGLPMDVIYCGHQVAEDTSVLKSDKMEALIAYLREIYDVVIIDTPPVAMLADASMLLRKVDATLFVVRYDYAAKRLIRDGLERINRDGVRHLGYVINAVEHKVNSYDKYSYRKYGKKYYS